MYISKDELSKILSYINVENPIYSVNLSQAFDKSGENQINKIYTNESSNINVLESIKTVNSKKISETESKKTIKSNKIFLNNSF